ncbi:MAG: hypothetical protein COU71_01895 [Parcubacteria group bacterium CG10_big_fil_rev_8_21_14_0_10_38_31]|nr:MAG: hypothetical protein COU71_01895 [Parcubacteria group bacterium CG10_big_fil_rev_8_21_14_0_10_38_31]
MDKEIHKLTQKDVASLFGTEEKDMSEECSELISKTDFSYTTLQKEERDAVILEVLKKIESGRFSIAGKEKRSRWKEGWQEILDGFVASGYDTKKLMPQYDIKPGLIIRINKEYISPTDPMLEMRWLNIFRRWIFGKYLKDADNIYEFGCGTAQNLVVLADLFPEKNIFGSEWVEAPLEIIKLLAEKKGYNIRGRLFDIFSPDENFELLPNSAVLTRAALEQIGPDYEKFLDFLIKKSPSLCVNIEPIVELYDEGNLVDHLAIMFQKKRNYLDGYLNRLYELKEQGKIEIIEVKRVAFGSIFLDPYSYVVWKPKK